MTEARGRTVISCRAYGLLAFLPQNVSLEVHEDDDTGALFDALLEAAGLPAGLRRVDSTLDRMLDRYLVSETSLIQELQRIVDTQGPPGLWYQTWDGAILAHARGMLTDALTVGGIADLQPRAAIREEHDLRNIVNFVSADVVDVNVQSSTSLTTVRSDSDSLGPTLSAAIVISDIDYDFIEFIVSGDAIETGRFIGQGYADIYATLASGLSGSVTVRARRYNITTETVTVSNTIVEQDIDSIARFNRQRLNRDIFGGLAVDDIRSLARAFLQQYAFGLTQRSFEIRVAPDNIDTLLGDGTDFSGLYVGRPIVIINKGVAALGRISRVSIGANSPVLVARIEADSYISSEIVFIPNSFTRAVGNGQTYAITIPVAVGGIAPITYALNGALPAGATGFDTVTRVLSGVAPLGGAITQTAQFRAMDSALETAALGAPRSYYGTHNLASRNWQGCGLVFVGSIFYAGLVEATSNQFRLTTVDVHFAVDLTFIGNGYNLGSGAWTGVDMALVGSTVYAAFTENTSNDFYLYTVNTATGALTQAGTEYDLGTGAWNGAGMSPVGSALFVGLVDSSSGGPPDDFYLYTVNTSTGALTQIGTEHDLGPGAWLGAGMIGIGSTLFVGLVENTSNKLYFYTVNTSTGALTQIDVSDLPDVLWLGLGLTNDSSTLYIGLLDDTSNSFELYSYPLVISAPLTADFTLTMEISAGATPPPTPGGFNWRFDTLSAFETYFTIPQGSGSGHWEADTNAGSTSTGNTGPGTNNADDFVFAKASPGSTVNSTREANGIAALVAGQIDDFTDRDVIIRYIAAGRFDDGTGGGISVEGRVTGGAWTEIAFLHGWAYAATRSMGDTITDNDGVDFDVAQDGGWRDAAVSVPDTYDEVRLAPTYTATGQRARQDIALHSIRSA